MKPTAVSTYECEFKDQSTVGLACDERSIASVVGPLDRPVDHEDRDLRSYVFFTSFSISSTHGFAPADNIAHMKTAKPGRMKSKRVQ